MSTSLSTASVQLRSDVLSFYLLLRVPAHQDLVGTPDAFKCSGELSLFDSLKSTLK